MLKLQKPFLWAEDLFCNVYIQRIDFRSLFSAERKLSQRFVRISESVWNHCAKNEIAVTLSELTFAEMSDSSSGLNHAAANPTTYFHSLSSTNPMNGLATDLSDLAIGDRPPPRKIRRRNALTVQDPHYPHVVPPPNRWEKFIFTRTFLTLKLNFGFCLQPRSWNFVWRLIQIASSWWNCSPWF